MFTKEERILLKRLAAGEFDGRIGDDLDTYYKYIKDGIPVEVWEGKTQRFFDNRTTERFPGKIKKLFYKTDEEKLEFLRKFGFLINDPQVRKYSQKFKPKSAKPRQSKKPSGKSARLIGETLGISSRQVNLLLLEAGLLDGEPGNWTLTAAGEKYGRWKEVPNGYGAYLTWDEDVIDILDQLLR